MKRRKIYCLLLAIISSILLSSLTIKFVPADVSLGIAIFIMNLAYTCSIFVSILGIIEDMKTKENFYMLLVGLVGIIMFNIFLILLYGEIYGIIKIILLTILYIAFPLEMILFILLMKHDSKKL